MDGKEDEEEDCGEVEMLVDKSVVEENTRLSVVLPLNQVSNHSPQRRIQTISSSGQHRQEPKRDCYPG